jgi:hypothetical protein
MIFVKYPETDRFLFFLAHILAYMVFISAPGSSQPSLAFFFNVRVCQVTPSLKAHFAKNTTHYLFPEYFQRLCAIKVE